MAQGTHQKSEGKTRGNMTEGRTRTQGLFVCLEVNIFFFWNQVVQDVGSQCSNTEGLDGSTSPIIQRKLELDKVCVSVFSGPMKAPRASLTAASNYI